MADTSGDSRASRRLAAILAADVAGYSALMGADEEGTVQDLKGHQAVILPMVGEHGGRIIDTAGDGILAEFSSVLGAVKCALAIQQEMADRNASVEVGRRMQFRIGINQGDVVFDEVRVYGDGVNVAARLEAIADPGGICISDKVHQEIRGKIDLRYHDLGPQQLKNIAELVRVYRIEHPALASSASRPGLPLPLPDKPSIAVLPFTNLSGDSKEDYFSDGITEDIITELSRFSELFVIARNSSFQFKGKSPDIRQVGRELGVRHVLEGSIRRAGDRVRITAQLVDARTGAHRWAERYDRKLEDVFAVQDEVTCSIVSILAAHVSKAEAERTLLKPPATWDAYDHCLRAGEALTAFWSSFDVRDLYEARRILEHSLSTDPNYARAYATLAATYVTAWLQPLDNEYLNPVALDRAHDFARRAVQIDPNLPQAHLALGTILMWRRQHDASLAEFQRAIELNPNLSDFRFVGAHMYAGEPEIAIEIALRHMRSDPFYVPFTSSYLGMSNYLLGQYAEAVRALRQCVSRAPRYRGGHSWLAATYAQLGQLEEARKEAAEVLRISPEYTIEGTVRPLSPFKFNRDAEHLFEGLRKAGLLDG